MDSFILYHYTIAGMNINHFRMETGPEITDTGAVLLHVPIPVTAPVRRS